MTEANLYQDLKTAIQKNLSLIEKYGFNILEEE